MSTGAPVKEKIIEIVRMIPYGRVVSFGTVAQLAAYELEQTVTAQLVGWQLSGMHPSERDRLPRWRVVNKAGYVSSLKLGAKGHQQIAHLTGEDIPVTDGHVDMEQYAVSLQELFDARAS